MEHTPPSTSNEAFAPTRWTVVLRARGDTAEAKAALGALCEAYWQPIFRFLRRSGRDEESARELTQEFCARLLAGDPFVGVDPGRGRFRSFLLGAVKHFLADVRDHDQRQKRGGGAVLESLDAANSTETTGELLVPDPAAVVPDEVFDREWALAVMARALSAVERELSSEGKGEQFKVLQPWLAGDAAGGLQADAALKLGMSEGAVKVAVHRLRRRFREAVRSEVSETLRDTAEVQEELRYLVEVLSHG
ncbi:MAG TPA: ECF-type sigma factor [Verrucomicrobiae bacterium]